MTIREQIIKEVATTDDDQLLQELLSFLRSRQAMSSDRPRRGSYEALMQYAGTVSDADAKEMTDIINREFNNIEGEW